jgi:NADH-quinone oxidoreductase subunit F
MSKLIKSFEKYGVRLQKLDISGAVLAIGTLLSYDNKKLIESVVKSSKELIYLSAIEDTYLNEKTSAYIKYEIGSEAGVLALLAKSLLNDTEDKDVKSYLNELDEGYLGAESSVGDDEIEKITKLFDTNNSVSLLLGSDLDKHAKSDAIAGLIALIARFKKLRVSVLDERELGGKPNDILPPLVEDIKSFDGTIVYLYASTNEEELRHLYGSSQFAIAAKIGDNDKIIINTKSGIYERVFSLSSKLKGTTALLASKKIEGYPFELSKITKKALNG